MAMLLTQETHEYVSPDVPSQLALGPCPEPGQALKKKRSGLAQVWPSDCTPPIQASGGSL